MPVIRVDDDVFRALQKLAEPLVDTPNTVLRTLLRLDGSKATRVEGGRPRASGKFTGNREYRRPILESLYELGGSGEARKVVELVGSKMKPKLWPGDLEVLPSGTLRWEKGVNWERFAMVRDGLLKKDSPRGLWELTERGLREIEGHVARPSGDRLARVR